MTTGVGPIKLVSTGGSITVNGGADTLGISSASTGDVLLEARDTDHDVVLNASVSVGGAGNVTLDADDDVLLNAAVTISTVGGDVVLLAGNDSGSGGVTMAGTSLVSSGDGNVRVEAESGGDILLSSIDAGVGSVVLLAGGNITDNNGTTLNVQALGLLLVAGGKIGDAGAALDADGDNCNAIDTSVDTLAAAECDGDLRPGNRRHRHRYGDGERGPGELQIDHDGPAADAGRPGATGVGPIKLVSTGGSITVNGGADTLGISSASTGDVLLNARDTDHDVVLNASVSVGGAGNVTLDADDDVLLNAAVTISTVGGDVVLLAGNDSGSGGVTMAGTSLVSSGDGNVRVEGKAAATFC